MKDKDVKEIHLLGELSAVLNKYSVENESNTPDYILASYVRKCLIIYAETINLRERHAKTIEHESNND